MDQGGPTKLSFCRFYLRGLCILSAKECGFAHGVWDLNYQYYQQGEEAKDHKQRNFIKGPRIFKNLYEFQKEKKYTLEQLNADKDARFEVRAAMHQQLYDEFMQLLEIKHPDVVFTEKFLLREFSRVGFNKVLLIPLRFNHIASYLCDNYPLSRFFRAVKVVAPSPGKQNVLVRRAAREEIAAAYRAAYSAITEGREEVEEGAFKKALFTARVGEDVPPISTVLKETKMGLREFIADFLGVAESKVRAESSAAEVAERAEQFLAAELPLRMVEWGDVFGHLSKALGNNNGNLLNQARPLLAARHAFLFFPKHELIYSPLAAPFLSTLLPAPCDCPFREPFPPQALAALPSLAEAEPLPQGEVIEVFDFASLARCAPHILASSVLGVDLEGRLRRGGFVEMVQLCNGRNTFLLDVLHMNERADFEAFWLARKVLRNAMLDGRIVKVFHDCRHDSVGLHEFLETCVANAFDTSAVDTLLTQLQAYEQLWQGEGQGGNGRKGKGKEGKEGNQEKEEKQEEAGSKEREKGKPQGKGKGKTEHRPPSDPLSAAKAVLSQCANVRTPGLNEVLGKYEASHGLNRNKEKYHAMWGKGDLALFVRRPLDPDYRDYCVRDVLDLPEVYAKMLSLLAPDTEPLARWISNEYAKQGYQTLTQEDKK